MNAPILFDEKPAAASSRSSPSAIPALHNGDHMDAEEFHRRYLAMPQVNKAELIEGVVYMPSPVSHELHGKPHSALVACLYLYSAHTPGVCESDNPTVRLNERNEVQPDAILMIEPAYRGQTQIVDGYIRGAPELVIEIAASTVSIDRHAKLRSYQNSGVREYLIWRVLDQVLDGFRLVNGVYTPAEECTAWIWKSAVFPGLWLSVDALLQGNRTEVLHTLQQGLASAEHAAFVARLQQARTAAANPSTEVER